jgi:hypothetical protein
MVKKQKNYFQLRIANCGVTGQTNNYETIKETNAAQVIEQAVLLAAGDMVGHEYDVELCLTVGFMLLRDTYAKFKEIPDSKLIDEFIKKWEIKQDGDN